VSSRRPRQRVWFAAPISSAITALPNLRPLPLCPRFPWSLRPRIPRTRPQSPRSGHPLITLPDLGGPPTRLPKVPTPGSYALTACVRSKSIKFSPLAASRRYLSFEKSGHRATPGVLA
jgi:hypothetical protein